MDTQQRNICYKNVIINVGVLPRLATGEPYPIPAAGLHNQIVRIEVRMYYKQSVFAYP